MPHVPSSGVNGSGGGWTTARRLDGGATTSSEHPASSVALARELFDRANDDQVKIAAAELVLKWRHEHAQRPGR